MRRVIAAGVAGVAGLGAVVGLTGAWAERPAQPEIAGYGQGSPSVPHAPLSLEELEKIKASVLWTEDDAEALRMSREVLEPHVHELVGVWYGFVGSSPHLLEAFVDPATGEANAEYLGKVRVRFERWVLDTASADYDQAWLDYQFEIGRRHHRSGKNVTDGVSASAHVPFRYIPALIVPITTTIRPFLERGGHTPEEVERMHAAWVKSVTIQAILWSYPYVREGDF